MKHYIKIDDISFAMKMVFYNFVENSVIKNFTETMSEEIYDKIISSSSPDELMLDKEFNDLIKEKEKDLPVFKFYNLMEQIETYKLSGTPLDINVHPIDDFMVEVYKTSLEMERLILFDSNEAQAFEDNKELREVFEEAPKKMSKNLILLKEFFDDVMLNFAFTETEIRAIQMNYLKDMLNSSVQEEKFEESAKIRDRIKNDTL